MKKILKSKIFLVIITMILSVETTAFAAILYQANQVGYTPSDKSWSVTAVDQALNDLYSTMKTKLNSTTATDSQILSGATAYSKGSLVTGTMANNGAVSTTINPGASYTIPAGYHNGSGTVTANGVSSIYNTNNPRVLLTTNAAAGISNTYRGGGTINCYLDYSVNLQAFLASTDTTYYATGTVYGYSKTSSTWVLLSTAEGTYSVSPSQYTALLTNWGGRSNIYDLGWGSSDTKGTPTLTLKIW